MINIILLHISKRKKVVSLFLQNFKKLRGNRYLKKLMMEFTDHKTKHAVSPFHGKNHVYILPLTDISIFIFTKKQIKSFLEICNRKYLPWRFNATVRAMRHDIKCDNIWSNSFFYSYRTVYKQQGVFFIEF